MFIIKIKIITTTILFSVLLHSSSSGMAIINKDSAIKPFQLKEKYLLKKYENDDTCKALIKYWFGKRMLFASLASLPLVAGAGMGIAAATASNNVANRNPGDGWSGLVILGLTVGAVYAGLFALALVIPFILKSRRKLVRILENIKRAILCPKNTEGKYTFPGINNDINSCCCYLIFFLKFLCRFAQTIVMNEKFVQRIATEVVEIKNSGLYKTERIIESPQGAAITVNGKTVLNFCANNYLGLSSHPRVIEAAHKTIDKRGYGMSSVRFICGTQDIHKELEDKISKFLGTEDTILYAAAFDANGGVFEPLFNEQDAIISDALNHASIIDGVRLCKAQRYRYEHNNMQDLEAKLQEAAGCRSRIIVTDGSFSMDGTIAQLDKIVVLAEKYDAVIMIDECHSSGFWAKQAEVPTSTEA
jgi:hypothetical protein